METATINSVAPESTTAALAAEVSKESDTVAISSAAPESTTASLAGGVPVEQLTPGAGDVPGGFPETPASEVTDPTPVVAGEQEQVFFAKPLPASETAANPMALQPGEAVPQIGTEWVHSHVKLDKESYEEDATNYSIDDWVLPDIVSPAEQEVIETPAIAECNTAAEQAVEIAAEQATVIADQVSEQAKSAAAVAAGPVEKPASPVPEVVKQSISEAGAPAEATANGELVEAKQEVETELKQKVVPSLPITEGPKEETAAVVAAEPTPAPAALVNAAKIPEQKAPVVTNGINTKTIMHHEITLNKPADVPEPVKHVAEAASEPKSVERKEAVEEQLKENVRPSAPTPPTNGASGAKTSIETPRKSTEATSSAKKSKRRSFFGAIFSKLPFVRS